MRIKLTSLMVDDQSKALRFYTEVLGFTKKLRHSCRRVSMDHGHRRRARRPRAGAGAECESRWQGVSRRDVRAGHPGRGLRVGDIQAEFARLTSHGVAFTREPTSAGPVTLAVFSDTCGNLIQLYQPN